MAAVVVAVALVVDEDASLASFYGSEHFFSEFVCLPARVCAFVYAMPKLLCGGGTVGGDRGIISLIFII